MTMGGSHAGELLPVRAIGRIRTPFFGGVGTPIQPAFSQGAAGQVVVDPAYADALDDLDGFERAWLLFWMDRAKPSRNHVIPYRDHRERGLFSTRSPSRPNPIGLSVVRLLSVERNRIEFEGVDLLDGTPVLDIKPYVPEFDAEEHIRLGWLEQARRRAAVSDGRFRGDDDGGGNA